MATLLVTVTGENQQILEDTPSPWKVIEDTPPVEGDGDTFGRVLLRSPDGHITTVPYDVVAGHAAIPKTWQWAIVPSFQP